MAYKTSETVCVVYIVPLRVGKALADQCEAIRREAGRCWSDMVLAHVDSRDGKWLTSVDLGKQFKSSYALHSQTIQALAQKLEANVDTARKLREQETKLLGEPVTKYPYRTTDYQTPVWKEQGIRVRDGKIILSNGRNQQPLILPLANEYHAANIRKAELTWRASRYELCLTIDTGEVNPPLLRKLKTAGVDLGEINIAACVTDEGETVVITGRHLRSVKQLRNKRHAELTSLIDKCQKGSRRWRRLKRRKAQATAKLERQQRDILHKASRQVVGFCQEQEVAHISIGDVKDIADGVNNGRHNNQKISQWPHGQFAKYIEYKARRYGISTTQDPEDYSTRTCSHCGQVKTSVKGRVYKCSGCGVTTSRDANGGANICSRKRYGEYGHVQATSIMYLRPISVGRSRAFDTGQRYSLA